MLFRSEALAMKADGTDPEEIVKFLNTYIDRTAMYEQELKSKLSDFYSILKWDYPTLDGKKAQEFFAF